MVEKIYILTHTDLDGYFSGGLAKYFYLKFRNPEAEFKIKHWTYGRDLPATSYIKYFDKVFILDLCPDTDFMLELYEHFKENFVWVDHHIAPDNEFLSIFKEKYPDSEIEGLRATEEHTDAGMSLSWKYFTTAHKESSSGYSLLQHIPEWVKLLSEFDCWNRKDETRWKTRIMPFFTYMKSRTHSADDAYDFCKELEHAGFFYDIIKEHGVINHYIDKLVEYGKYMYEELQSVYDSEAFHGFERVLPVIHNGEKTTIKAWICNTQNRSSVIFENFPRKDEFDVFIPYHFNGEKYFYSMYTFKPDIACNQISVLFHKRDRIAEFHGHKDAAGSNSIEFIFEEPNP